MLLWFYWAKLGLHIAGKTHILHAGNGCSRSQVQREYSLRKYSVTGPLARALKHFVCHTIDVKGADIFLFAGTYQSKRASGRPFSACLRSALPLAGAQ